MSVPVYHSSCADAVLVALTARRADRHYFGDCRIVDWRAAGLPKASKAKGVVQTIDRSLISRRLGALVETDRIRLRYTLHAILDL